MYLEMGPLLYVEICHSSDKKPKKNNKVKLKQEINEGKEIYGICIHNIIVCLV